MFLARMCFATAVSLFVSLIALGEETDYNNPDAALLHDMEILDAEVRNSALAGYKRRFNLSDDKFSTQLVKLAMDSTNRANALPRGFIVGAICDFGTTNALHFLEEEALYGGSSAGIKGYGLITGFDERFFALSERILADKRDSNSGRRDSTYRVFKSLISSSRIREVEISKAIQIKAKKALLRHSLSDSYHRVLIDMILLGAKNEETPYRYSKERLNIAKIACEDLNSSNFAQSYFKNAVVEVTRRTIPSNTLFMTDMVSDQKLSKQLTSPNTFTLNKGDDEAQPLSPAAPPSSFQQAHRWLWCLVVGVGLLFGVNRLVKAGRQLRRRQKRAGK